MKPKPLWIVVVVVFAALVAIVLWRPDWLSDQNAFLREFVNHEYLNVLGVIFAISLASLAQAHLSLNRIEERRGYECFENTRAEIKSAACWLIGLFALAVVVVVAKPLVGTTDVKSAGANVTAILILTMYVLVLLDITMAVFAIRPEFGDDKSSKGR